MSMGPSKELELLEELEASTKYAGSLGFFYQEDGDSYGYAPIGPEVDRELGIKPSKQRISDVCKQYGFSKVVFLDYV